MYIRRRHTPACSWHEGNEGTLVSTTRIALVSASKLSFLHNGLWLLQTRSVMLHLSWTSVSSRVSDSLVYDLFNLCSPRTITTTPEKNVRHAQKGLWLWKRQQASRLWRTSGTGSGHIQRSGWAQHASPRAVAVVMSLVIQSKGDVVPGKAP